MERIPTQTDNESHEVAEQIPAITESAYSESKLKQLLADPDVRKGVGALARTLINAGIATADMVPLIGDKVSWAADGWKILAPMMGLKHLDLSRSVSKFEALATEGAEVVTLGIAPSHLYELIMQLKREDLELLKVAFISCKRILKEEQTDYENHKAEIDNAMSTFKEKSA